MASKRFFLQWVLFLSLLSVGTIIFYFVGGFHFINEYDRTPICFTIMALFAGMTIWYAKISWDIDSLFQKKWWETSPALASKIKQIELVTGHGQWIENTCTGLGFLGTVIGLFWALIDDNLFFQILSNNQVHAETILTFIKSMTTAPLTTIVGIIAFILLSFQTHIILHAVAKLQLQESDNAET